MDILTVALIAPAYLLALYAVILHWVHVAEHQRAADAAMIAEANKRSWRSKSVGASPGTMDSSGPATPVDS